jgi:hypothetical protein
MLSFAWNGGPTWRGICTARLRHIASTKWRKPRYRAMDRLLNPAKQEQEAAA